MRQATSAAGLALAVLLLSAAPALAAPAAPALDLPSVEAALRTEQVHRAPGAVAELDLPRVQAALPPGARVLLAPPLTTGDDGDADYRALSAFAGHEDLHLVLVRGVRVQVVGQGTVVPDDLLGTRAQLAHHDVTEELVYAGHALQDPDHDDGDERRPLTQVPADPGLVQQVAAGLAAGGPWVAPGVTADVSGDWAAHVPGLTVRVAVLPVLPLGAPDPDLLSPLGRRFPGDLVVVVRGTWLEATGPGPREVESARDHLLGLYQSVLSSSALEPRQLLEVFLQRLGVLRAGIAFGRPQVRAVTVHELFSRWAPRVGLGLGVLVGGGSAAWALAAAAQRRRAAATAYRQRHARVLAVTARLAADLLASPRHDPLVAQAADRYATARGLLDEAEASGDPEVLEVALEAAEQGRAALAGASA